MFAHATHRRTACVIVRCSWRQVIVGEWFGVTSRWYEKNVRTFISGAVSTSALRPPGCDP